MKSSSTPFLISAFYAASFVPIGVHLPFYPVLLAARGQDAAAIAVITTLPIVLRVTTASALGAFADRLGDRRLALVVYCAATLAGALLIGAVGGFWGLLIATLVMSAPWNGILPVTDALATGAVRRGEAVYGRMRVWGSISFVVVNLAAGWVAGRHGADGIWLFLVVGMAVQFAAAFLLPRDRAEGSEARAQGPGMLAAMRELAGDRVLMAVLVGVALMQGSHAMLYGFSSIHWASLGFSGDEIGALWALGVIGEIALFAASGKVLSHVSPRMLVAIGGIGGTVRWALFPLLDGTFWPWIFLQTLHAASFAAIHLGVMTVIARRVEDGRAATVQGMMVSGNGFTMALATLASGPLYQHFGGGAFAAMSVLAAVGGFVLVRATGAARRVSAPSAEREAQPQSAGTGG